MKSILAAGLMIAICGPALAQQAGTAPCKGYYTVGETVPAGCAQQTINASNYASWGNGAPANQAPAAPSLFGTGPTSPSLLGRRF